MKKWITADLHFAHANILKFQSETRKFDDVHHMNEEIIRIWNENVAEEDTTYILGDVAFCQPKKAAEFVRRLNGNKILIEGNHDEKALTNQYFRDSFVEIHKYLEIKHNGTRVCMFHFPILEWNQCHRGSVMLNVHLHGNPNELANNRIRDVGFDATGNVVSLLDDMVNDALTGEFRTHGWK